MSADPAISEATLIGLGAMGSALAKAFLRAGHVLTVWNRNASRIPPLAALGARQATSLADAIERSPVILFCLDGYGSAIQLIDEYALQGRLKGRRIIQFSTGTVGEANDFAKRLTGYGCDCLDGAIFSYPGGIGLETTPILLSGSADAYRQCLPLLRCVGGDLRYLGQRAGAAAALDMALLNQELWSYLGAIYSTALCKAEGIEPSSLVAMLPEHHPARQVIEIIDKGEYANPGATLTTWHRVARHIQAQARSSGISGAIPDSVLELLEQALDEGYGKEDLAALFKVVGDKRSRAQ